MGESWEQIKSRRFADQTPAGNNDTVADKLGREALLLAKGTFGGIKHGFQEAVDDPFGSGLRLAGSIGVGVALTCMQRQAGLLRLGSQLFGGAMAWSFTTDVLAAGRWSAVTDAMSDTWKSKAHFNQNVRSMEHNLGRFAFDTGFMMAGGAAGAGLGRAYLTPRGMAVSDVLRGLKGDYGKWEIGRPPKDLPAEFEAFPHRAKSFIESGKDAVVIELENSRILKILKNPLLPDAGKRSFDLPILERGTVANGRLSYIIQPKVEINQSKTVMNEFADMVRKQGYNFWDREPTQLGFFEGKVVLVDYNAVAKLYISRATR